MSNQTVSNADFVFERNKNTSSFEAALLDASALLPDEFPTLTPEDLKRFFAMLPEDIQNDAMDHGLNDNLVRDDIYYFFKENQKLLKFG